jgi:hypothetical protein
MHPTAQRDEQISPVDRSLLRQCANRTSGVATIGAVEYD